MFILSNGKSLRSCCAAFCCLVLSASFLHGQKIRDPKASFLDVAARRTFLQAATDPRIQAAVAQLPSCVALPPVEPPRGTMEIPKHYLQDSHGPTNPSEAAATRVYSAFEKRIAAGMNRYVVSGSEAEARCALDQLDQWAQARALLNYDRQDSPQAWYQVEWTLSAAGTTDSVLVSDTSLDAIEQQRVTKWLDTAVRHDISFERPGDVQNNHHYWRALAATAVGVTASDGTLFHFGIGTYKEAIDDIDRNGAFPKEMARHERALHYQMFAIDPLIMIAEFASRQGIDLYSYSSHRRTLRDAILFFGRSLGDPSLIRAYTPEEQVTDFGHTDFATLEFYIARFGAVGLPPALLAALAGPTSFNWIGGSATLLAAR